MIICQTLLVTPAMFYQGVNNRKQLKCYKNKQKLVLGQFCLHDIVYNCVYLFVSFGLHFARTGRNLIIV